MKSRIHEFLFSSAIIKNGARFLNSQICPRKFVLFAKFAKIKTSRILPDLQYMGHILAQATC